MNTQAMNAPSEGEFEPTRTVSAKDAMQMLDISYPTLNRWIKLGYLDYIKLPSKRRRIPVSEIERLLTKKNRGEPVGE